MSNLCHVDVFSINKLPFKYSSPGGEDKTIWYWNEIRVFMKHEVWQYQQTKKKQMLTRSLCIPHFTVQMPFLSLE